MIAQENIAVNNLSQKSVRQKTFAFVGNPNSGKTTLFNQLTGLRQKVANYPGVTVEKKTGTCYTQHGNKITLIDLPGAYSLSAESPDEQILQKALLGEIEGTPRPDCLVCVVDASNLERALFLVTQVCDLGLPTLLVLNMADVAKKNGLIIDTGVLEKELGVRIVLSQATNRESILNVRLALSRKDIPQATFNLELPKPISEAVLTLQAHLLSINPKHIGQARGEALFLLTEGILHPDHGHGTSALVKQLQSNLDKTYPNWKSEIIKARYQRIEKLHAQCTHRVHPLKKGLSEYLDNFFLHNVYGWVSLLLILGSLFWGIFTLSEYPMKGIEWCFGQLGIFVEEVLPEGPLQNLIVNGIISGVGSVVVFLPQILMLFFFIGVLESTGYLPRAAFLLDRVMSKVGLNGKSFIPFLSSYACAVPGIMASRTIASKEERLATILVAPWMSCSARLPVYLLMIATLVPNSAASPLYKALILLIAYSLGTFSALTVAWIFRKTLLKGQGKTAYIELPPYRVPSWKNIFIECFRRGMLFIKKAGKIILAFSIILWFLMSYPKVDFSDNQTEQLKQSYLGTIGKSIEPVIKPLGFDWKIGIGILSSFAARELFVSTMAIIYSNSEDFYSASSLAPILKAQILPQNNSAVFSPLTCISLLVFFIFAMQCMSTLVITYKETQSLKWPIFQLGYMTVFAYLASLLVFQVGSLIFL